MAVIHLNVLALLIFAFTGADSSPKIMVDKTSNSIVKDEIHGKPKPNKDLRVLYSAGNIPPEILKAAQERLAKLKFPYSLLIIDKLIPEKNRIIFTIQVRTPMSRLRFQSAGAGFFDIFYGNNYPYRYQKGKKISVQSIFSDKS